MTREYEEVQRRLAQGWNTWNTRSVLSHVLLPAALAINLGFKEYAGGNHLRESLIGRFGADEEHIHPGARSYDGSYTALNLRWRGLEVEVQTATQGADWLALITPLQNQRKPATLIAEMGFLWNAPGSVSRHDGTLQAHFDGQTVTLFTTQPSIDEPATLCLTPYLALSLTGEVGLSTGKPRSLEAIRQHMAERKAALNAERAAHYGNLAEVYTATQTCLAWDTIYEPTHRRVVSPVSRMWNCNWGGYVLFDWDTYFAALMAALDQPDLAYANAVEITRARTDSGFIPNFEGATGKSEDRSEPPVGALVIAALYRRFGDRWLIEETFDDLLAWNRWWHAHRSTPNALLCWGSDPFEPKTGAYWEMTAVNDRQGAAFESGLDNSPMYDGIPFDPATHRLALADVGLHSMYVADCAELAALAEVIGRTAERDELTARAAHYRESLGSLWHDPTGMFLNRRTDTGEFSARLSPTHFYPFLAEAVSPAQAARMLDEHFYNPAEFWGEYALPSISRSDPAFPEQNYWRGRVWGPMNWLVYWGLHRAGQHQAAADLAEKSAALLLKEWRTHGHVHENYNTITGEGCDIASSDKFYHWGGLLGWIALHQAGFFA